MLTRSSSAASRWLLAGLFLLAAAAQAATIPDFTKLFKENHSAVVAIRTVQTEEGAGAVISPEMFPDLPEDSPFREFFRRFFEMPHGAPKQEHKTQGLGSGFIISEDGYILTAAHVVKDADNILVRLSDRRELEAKVIGVDERTDVALIKIDAKDLPTAHIGDSDKLQVGEWVLAIGAPFGFEYSATQGIVSALGRNLPSESYVPFIQTDVAVNPGSSGGPLINGDGEVVGINSQIFSRSGGYMGLSFAIPINVAMNVAKQLQTKGYVSRGWLGVLIQPVTKELAESFGLDRPTGALIAQVMPDSPASEARLQPGDIILEFDGHKVESSGQLPPIVGNTPVGKRVKIKILRDGKPRTVEVTIRELKEEKLKTAQARGTLGTLGMTVADLTPEEREELGLKDHGVRVVEVTGGPAAEAGLRKGDIIESVNHRPVKSVKGLRELLETLPKGKPIPVLIRRNDGALFLALTLPKS